MNRPNETRSETGTRLMRDEVLHNSLRVQRAIRDLTQGELADRAGVTRKSVNAIEGARMVPSVLLALKLARVLGVSVETLFSLDDASPVAADDRRQG